MLCGMVPGSVNRHLGVQVTHTIPSFIKPILKPLLRVQHLCSTTPVSSVKDVMGPGCVESFTESLSFAKGIPSDTKTMFMNFLSAPAVFPAPCIKKSPLSLGVAACNVATTNLAVTCPENTNSYVASSPFTPKQTTVASLTFNSGGLTNVRLRIMILHFEPKILVICPDITKSRCSSKNIPKCSSLLVRRCKHRFRP